MEMFIFGRFHAKPGNENAVREALLEVRNHTRAGEPGCLAIDDFRSTRDPRLFWVYSRFVDEEAFELHARLPHTVRFLEKVEELIDHPLDITRAERLG